MDKQTEKTVLKITLGFVMITVLALGGVLVAAVNKPKVSAEEAKQAALGLAEGEITEMEVETEDGKEYYDIEITNEGVETDVLVDTTTGEAMVEVDDGEYEADDDDEDELDEEDEAQDVPITGSALEKASAVALNYIGEGRVTGTEVGDEEGYYEIEVTLDNGRQVDVHLDEDFNVINKAEDTENPHENEGSDDFEDDGIGHEYEGDEGDHED
jgi:uncharacterized membrane protein YkoI